MKVRVQRVYEAKTRRPGGCARILVDRLWPRGVSKQSLDLDRWVREVAPSTELRRWYGHRPERFDEFAGRYRLELREPEAKAALDELVRVGRHRGLTLLTATRDVEHSGATVLASVLRKRRG